MKQKFYLLLLLPLLFFTTILSGCKKQHDPNKAIQNLSVSYNEDISNILISEFSFNQEKLEIKNLDQNIFTFKVIKTTFENNSFIVRYCLVNNKTKQESEFRKFSVTNFLTIEALNEKLKDELKKITIDYPNLKNTYISEFNLANIVTNLDYDYQISHQIIFQDVTKVDVKTTISHKKYSQVKETITTSFTGFLVTKQDEINFAAKAVSATINIPKEYRTIKNSEVTENDIKFTNYETALYDIVVLGFSERNNELVLSFQLKDKINGELVSTNQEISFKLFEYYKEKLPEALS